MLLDVRLQNGRRTLHFRSRVLGQDQMFQLPVCPSELHVETYSHGAEDSDTAQSDNRESTTLKRRVYVCLEVEIVLVILNHPEPKIGND